MHEKLLVINNKIKINSILVNQVKMVKQSTTTYVKYAIKIQSLMQYCLFIETLERH